jgi:hypothetical protein
MGMDGGAEGGAGRGAPSGGCGRCTPPKVLVFGSTPVPLSAVISTAPVGCPQTEQNRAPGSTG